MSNANKHLVVCSVENRYYHAWQAKVFTYSCMFHQGVAPLILVHGGHEDLSGGFKECEEAGALVVPTRNHRHYKGVDWAARNTVAALIDAALIGKDLGATHIVLMDPDIVWTRKVSWPDKLAVDRCPNDLRTGLSQVIAKELGIELVSRADNVWGSRVPYIVPIEHAEDIGKAWWVIMDKFAEKRDYHWSDQMCAWSLALAALDLPPKRITLSQTNWTPEEAVVAPLIHYAYPNTHWNKRWFVTETDGNPWIPPRLMTNTVQGWVHREVVRAGAFYDKLLEAVS